MSTSKRDNDCCEAGVGLILIGMALALLGAASVMLLVLGASGLYVGRFKLGLVELAGFILGGSLFLKSYGPYLTRLEKHAPVDPTPEATSLERTLPESAMREERSADPLPISIIVSLATGAYGLLVAAGGLIWTQGSDLMLNLLAGGALLIAAVLVWRLGRTSSKSNADG